MPNIDAGERRIDEIVKLLHRLGRKRWGVLTLTPSVASTTVTDPTITVDSVILLVEQTANAAAAKYATPWCIPIAAKGSFSIAHANNAQTDRRFLWIALGD